MAQALAIEGGSEDPIQTRFAKKAALISGLDPSQQLTPLDVASGAARTYDAFGGAPARAALGAAMDSRNPAEAFVGQFGEDPTLAPTGYDLAGQAGIKNELARKMVGAAGDLTIDPFVLGGLLKRAPLYAKEAMALPDIAKAKWNYSGAYQPTTGKEFYHAIEKARNLPGKRGEEIRYMTTKYSPEELEAMQPFLHPDKQSGFVVKPDSEVTSLFSLARGRGDDLTRGAISEGARKLDNFDLRGKLPELYGRHGFSEYDRVPNWTPGEPDVSFMKMGAPHSVDPYLEAIARASAARSLETNSR